MKVFLLLLLLANALFYSLNAGYLGESESPEAVRLSQQIAPEKIRIVGQGTEANTPATKAKAPEVEPPPPAPAPAAEATAGAKAELAQAEAVKPTPPTPAPVPESKGDAPVACMSWDKVALADAERLSTAMAGKFGDYQLVRKASGGNEGAAWWVYIPPLADKAEAEKKAGELRLFGVSDFFIVQEGPNRFAISLGIFSVEKGGQDRLAELKGRGVRSARLGARPGKEGYYLIEASGPEAGMAKLVTAVGKVLPKLGAQSCK